MAMEDWATRKMAIDVIYTFAAILKDVLIPFKAEILEVLNHSRFDKFKPVREATLEAYQVIKPLGGEESYEQEKSTQEVKQSRPSIRDAIRQDKKTKKSAKNQSKAHTLEILDKSDTDKKLSAATQKRMERKNDRLPEDKKDNEPISYDNVKSQVFKGPKNTNFFKKNQVNSRKAETAAPVEIFTSGDRDQFDYEADFKNHQKQEAIIKHKKAQDQDLDIQIYESKRPQNEERKGSPKGRYTQYEDTKIGNSHDDRPIGGAISMSKTKAPEEIPVQIFVKGAPKEQSEEKDMRERALRDNYITESSRPTQAYEQPRAVSKQDFVDRDAKVQGEEYEQSMNLLKQHQEMMRNKASKPAFLYKDHGKLSPKAYLLNL